jgi:hypothetical protein
VLFFIYKTGDEKAMDILRLFLDGGESKENTALARNYCFNRCFIITLAGRMGIEPSDTRIGDTIAIIFGRGEPYIIRPRGASWAFVGESYIQGLVNGEAIQACQQGVVEEEISSL